MGGQPCHPVDTARSTQLKQRRREVVAYIADTTIVGIKRKGTISKTMRAESHAAGLKVERIGIEICMNIGAHTYNIGLHAPLKRVSEPQQS